MLNDIRRNTAYYKAIREAVMTLQKPVILDIASGTGILRYNFVISTCSLHSGMCKKSKLRVYRELKEDFECKKYLHGVSDMGSKRLFTLR